MRNYQCQDGRGKEKGQGCGKLIKSGFRITWNNPHGMTGHFGMCVRCLVCPSDTHGQQELATC